jgi:hypothetical protein
VSLRTLIVIDRGAHKAQPALAFVQLAIARTNIALDTPIRESMAIAGWVAGNRLIHATSDLRFPELDMVISWRPGKMRAGTQS